MKQKSLAELMESYHDALAAKGISVSSRLGKMHRCTVLVHRHEIIGKDKLDEGVVAEYIREIGDRQYIGEIGESHANSMRRETERFVQFAKTGDFNLPNPLKVPRTKILPIFREIVEGFLTSESAQIGAGGKTISNNTRKDMRWVAHKYFEWLAEEGHISLRAVGAEQIQKFMLHCTETMAMGSVHNVRLFMMKLYAYLYESGQSKSSLGALLSFRVNRDSKISETRSADELAAMLETIDRTTKRGRRAYAVMMLGIVLGIRACDVIALKLNDIDWINGEIKILQAKTAVSIILPLTKDVGEALRDYILNARPASESENVFLRLKSPYMELKSAVT